MTADEYDQFLLIEKEGHFKRIGKFTSMAKTTDHQCGDHECARIWKPSPAQCLADDYYCPSCVLHHRNNEDRFKEDRLKWTADVPNTFYVFSITDPTTKTELVKFGRTQNEDAWKRYPTKEIKNYDMKLILQLRGRLITMTKIENWFKEQAEKRDLFCRFSEKEFHGLTECLKISSSVLEELLNKAKDMHEADAPFFKKIRNLRINFVYKIL